jgi:hypothetical protein
MRPPWCWKSVLPWLTSNSIWKFSIAVPAAFSVPRPGRSRVSWAVPSA